MAQATESTTTRRNFLAGAAVAATAGALVAVPSVTVARAIRPEWLALAAELEAASEAYSDAYHAELMADRNFADWLASNPAQQLGDWPEGDREAEKEAVAIYEAALNERGRRKVAEMRRCRLAATKMETNQARERHNAACEAVISLDATTLNELIFKARLTEHDASDNRIAASIAADLLLIEEQANLN